MTTRKIVTWPDRRLSIKTENVDAFDKELVQHSWDLYHTMLTSYGAGLASTQIGGSSSVCVVSKSYVPTLLADIVLEELCVVLVNPVIEVLGKETFQWEEACLSVPDIKAQVQRSNEIRLTYFDLSGNTIVKEISGIESATVQHEVDHLLGKLFINRLTGYTRDKVARRLKKRIRLIKKQNKKKETVLKKPRRKNPKSYGQKKK